MRDYLLAMIAELYNLFLLCLSSALLHSGNGTLNDGYNWLAWISMDYGNFANYDLFLHTHSFKIQTTLCLHTSRYTVEPPFVHQTVT